MLPQLCSWQICIIFILPMPRGGSLSPRVSIGKMECQDEQDEEPFSVFLVSSPDPSHGQLRTSNTSATSGQRLCRPTRSSYPFNLRTFAGAEQKTTLMQLALTAIFTRAARSAAP